MIWLSLTAQQIFLSFLNRLQLYRFRFKSRKQIDDRAIFESLEKSLTFAAASDLSIECNIN